MTAGSTNLVLMVSDSAVEAIALSSFCHSLSTILEIKNSCLIAVTKSGDTAVVRTADTKFAKNWRKVGLA